MATVLLRGLLIDCFLGAMVCSLVIIFVGYSCCLCCGAVGCCGHGVLGFVVCGYCLVLWLFVMAFGLAILFVGLLCGVSVAGVFCFGVSLLRLLWSGNMFWYLLWLCLCCGGFMLCGVWLIVLCKFYNSMFVCLFYLFLLLLVWYVTFGFVVVVVFVVCCGCGVSCVLVLVVCHAEEVWLLLMVG